MKRILGIDPGSRFTGYGIVELDNDRISWVVSGCIKVTGDDLASKLKVIARALDELLQTYEPHEAAIEKVFLSRNVDSALKLGQARGAAITTVSLRNIPLSEYSPNQVKKSVVGKGHAGKEQVQHMMKALLRLSDTPQEDAADALAIAVCHAQHCQTLSKLGSMGSASAKATNPLLENVNLRRSRRNQRWK